MRWDKIVVHQAFEGLLRVRHPADLIVDADKDAAKAGRCRVARVDEDAFKARNRAEPWYLAAVRLGPGADAEFGTDPVHVYDICPHRDSRLAINLDLAYLFQRMMALEAPVLVLNGVAEVDAINVEAPYGVRFPFSDALQCQSHSVSSSSLLTLPTMTDVSPCVTFASSPLSMALMRVPRAAKAKSSPTALRTEPSMAPVGGTNHDATSKMMAMATRV